MSEKVYIYAVGMTKFGKFLKTSMKDLTGQALEALKSDFNQEFNHNRKKWKRMSSILMLFLCDSFILVP